MTSRRSDWSARFAVATVFIPMLAIVITWRSIVFEIMGWVMVGLMGLVIALVFVLPSEPKPRSVDSAWERDLHRFLDTE